MVLLDALSRNNGTMAQFNLPELGGPGQWMSGGMTMVGDMFNYGLKSRVDALCVDLAGLLSAGPFRPAPIQADVSLFVGAHGGTGQWWPGSLGVANWQGSQNNLRYAYFAATSRLALEVNGEVSVYDTGGFTLTGVGQQQSSGCGASLTFTGPGGIVTLDRLRPVDVNSPRPAAQECGAPPAREPEPNGAGRHGGSEPRRDTVRVSGSILALDESLSGTRWHFATQLGSGLVLVTLDANGILAGIEGDLARYWAVEEAALWFYAADGRVTARFDRVVRGADGVQIVGTSPPSSDVRVVLREVVPDPVAPAIPSTLGSTTLERRLDLCAQPWAFGVRGGDAISALQLRPDGAVAGGTRASETSWRLDGGQLVFLHKSGRPTTRFTVIEIRDGLWTLSGPSLANDRIVHELHQLPAPP